MHQALLTLVFMFVALTSQSLQAQSIKIVVDAEFGVPGAAFSSRRQRSGNLKPRYRQKLILTKKNIELQGETV
jgi:hypothetical protein